jgi:hypothetical protein
VSPPHFHTLKSIHHTLISCKKASKQAKLYSMLFNKCLVLHKSSKFKSTCDIWLVLCTITPEKRDPGRTNQSFLSSHILQHTTP